MDGIEFDFLEIFGRFSLGFPKFFLGFSLNLATGFLGFAQGLPKVFLRILHRFRRVSFSFLKVFEGFLKVSPSFLNDVSKLASGFSKVFLWSSYKYFQLLIPADRFRPLQTLANPC